MGRAMDKAMRAAATLRPDGDPLYRVTQVAAALFKAPLSTVVMTEPDRLSFRAGVGLCGVEVTPEQSFTVHALEREDTAINADFFILVFPDAGAPAAPGQDHALSMNPI